MRAPTVVVVEACNNSSFPVGSHVVGFGDLAEYYVGTLGVNLLYKADIPGPSNCRSLRLAFLHGTASTKSYCQMTRVSSWCLEVQELLGH